MDQQNNISAVAPEMSVNKPSTPGPKLGKILIPLAVLVLLCIGYGVLAKNYNWWPHENSKPASNWQTFKSENYAIEIQYPSDWKVLPRGDEGSVVYVLPAQDYAIALDPAQEGKEALFTYFSISAGDGFTGGEEKMIAGVEARDSGWHEGFAGLPNREITLVTIPTFGISMSAGGQDSQAILDQILSTLKVSSSKTESAEQEEKLLTERQRIVVMASQYFQVEKKLPPSMAELNKWEGVTLTAEELEFSTKNFSWRLDGNKEVEVCIIPPLQFHSGGQCQTRVQVNAELSNWKTYQNNQYYFQYPADHTVYTTTRYDASLKKEVLVPADETSTAVSVAENTDSKYVFGGENITLSFAIYEYQDQLSDSKKSKEANSTYLGYPAKITRGAGNLGEEYLTIEMYLDNFIIRITQGAKSELLDTILQTFRVDASTRIEP